MIGPERGAGRARRRGQAFRWASVTKLVTALAVLIAVGPRADRARRGGRPAGRRPSATCWPTPRGSRSRARSPRGARDPADLLEPGVRRAWRAGRRAARGGRSRTPFARWVLGRSGWTDTTPRRASVAGPPRAAGRPCRARGRAAPADARRARRLSRPRPRSRSPGWSASLPGVGRFDPLDWGLGFELHDGKSPHWMGTRNSPATFGHFGGSGTFLWVDPVADLAVVALTDRDFGPWALGGVAAVLGCGPRRDGAG